jgi:protein-disulfide isomerase
MPKKTPPGSKTGPNRNLLIALGAGAAVVIAIVVGVLALGGSDEGIDASSAAYLDGIPQTRDVLGEPDAGVTLIQFEDLQCPVCQQYTEGAMPGIVEQYVRPGQVKLRFVGLAFLGPDSEKALRYTLAAGLQSKLWQYSELLYENQGAENSGWVTDDLLERIATALELDWDKLKADAPGASVTQQLNAMSSEGAALQIPGTPTFYIQVGDDEPYVVQPQSFTVEAFQPIFDDALGQ